MTARETRDLMELISAYHSQPIPPQTLSVWLEDLRDVTRDDALEAWRVYRNAPNRPHPPTSAQLLEIARSLRPPPDPNEAELRRRRHAYLERNGYVIPEWDR